MDRIKLLFVSCGGLGLAPVAPGTFGTLGGVAIAWALAPSGSFLLWTMVAAVVLFGIGRTLGEWSEKRAGGKDPGFYVIDEVIGYLVTVAWVTGPSLFTLVVAFFLFRLFDIIKPPPARQLESVPGGDGILLDDVAAGVWGLVVLAAGRLIFPDLPWDWGT